jgi:hypothetical protein
MEHLEDILHSAEKTNLRRDEHRAVIVGAIGLEDGNARTAQDDTAVLELLCPYE